MRYIVENLTNVDKKMPLFTLRGVTVASDKRQSLAFDAIRLEFRLSDAGQSAAIHLNSTLAADRCSLALLPLEPIYQIRNGPVQLL